jgi:hypothetical protein
MDSGLLFNLSFLPSAHDTPFLTFVLYVLPFLADAY